MNISLPLPSASCEVRPGRQSGLCEGPVHHLPLSGGGASGQQSPAGESTQIHAGPLVIGPQVLAQRYEPVGRTGELNADISSQGEHLQLVVLQKSSLTPP